MHRPRACLHHPVNQSYPILLISVSSSQHQSPCSHLKFSSRTISDIERSPNELHRFSDHSSSSLPLALHHQSQAPASIPPLYLIQLILRRPILPSLSSSPLLGERTIPPDNS